MRREIVNEGSVDDTEAGLINVPSRVLLNAERVLLSGIYSVSHNTLRISIVNYIRLV